MGFKYSRLIDPGEYETQGLCEGIPLRMHKQPQKEDVGTIRCQRDWSRLVKHLKNYKGGLHAKWNFMSTSVPECLPERLEIISYANEFAFLYDDYAEDCDKDQLDTSNDIMQEAFLEGSIKGSISVKRADGMRQMQALILKEMMAIDKERAVTTMKAWVEFLKFAGGRQHDKHFATLEEYIPYRSIDVGKW
ncbi:conserved hypothetical protein [Talaromyces stipitatus ATCC 10500]|uniref:Uncharacterized protein n=1 Tax=Talaromyces stipitatus (strain ATCC 10500 / CBS 375.48 / QM 6759 / NRRL 1006) TaxID=441959 RepID=B8LWT9_TALSN|nr:uncharacterized protein TSTA_079280 [Talaromyces stipitatus ATCC 10500]EED24572.1 conserved hypothetical protein [Talaromyces stipitatus ATCC 10500]